jgi:hypothetical protein
MEAEADDEIWQLFADRLWLHDLIRRSPPMPTPGFADRVVAASRVSPSHERGFEWFSRRALTRAAGWSIALAAAIACVVIGRPTSVSNRSAPEIASQAVAVHNVEPAGRETATVPNDLLASIWDLTGSRQVKPSVDPQIDRVIALVPSPRAVLGETFKQSTSKIVSAGKNLSDQVRPLSDSVGGAFGFLLDLPPASEKRSL